MKTTIAVLAVSLIAGAVSAQAADFNGFYAGADIGGGELQYDVPGTELTAHDGGVTYGAFGGWRTHFAEKWVAGVEGRYGDTDAKITNNGITLSSGQQWSASGLIGYQIGRKWLLYGTLGYENLKTHRSGGFGTANRSVDGIRTSLGVEYAMNDSVSLRLSSTASAYKDSIYYEDSSLNTVFFDNTSISGGSIAALFKF